MKHLLSALLVIALTTLATLGAMAGGSTSGTFTGKSNHITTGGVTIETHADGTATVTLDDDFSLDGAPDPRVAFGKDGAYVPAGDLGELKMLNGKQTYTVPASINVDDFNEIYIWCLKFSVPLGVAKLG
ncbi:DM13 domain-containing protein [Roseobacter sinensis]|uniref:DM13 domain-containing protein n=1 Tax=Roseobacter sinensis TaxID=2931391 RepID=A0ABT3B8B9_9RHOB|nr:DM13 domain-containing protein [Roseobacter sp. WL0113]MCV3269811.1 DM13 domain-containing protein [Roseobacter sp. WL0113]